MRVVCSTLVSHCMCMNRKASRRKLPVVLREATADSQRGLGSAPYIGNVCVFLADTGDMKWQAVDCVMLERLHAHAFYT